jgi:hypothetical protein
MRSGRKNNTKKMKAGEEAGVIPVSSRLFCWIINVFEDLPDDLVYSCP